MRTPKSAVEAVLRHEAPPPPKPRPWPVDPALLAPSLSPEALDALFARALDAKVTKLSPKQAAAHFAPWFPSLRRFEAPTVGPALLDAVSRPSRDWTTFVLEGQTREVLLRLAYSQQRTQRPMLTHLAILVRPVDAGAAKALYARLATWLESQLGPVALEEAWQANPKGFPTKTWTIHKSPVPREATLSWDKNSPHSPNLIEVDLD